jgi:hypothetical protein
VIGQARAAKLLGAAWRVGASPGVLELVALAAAA